MEMKTRLTLLLLTLALVALLAACGGGGNGGNVPNTAIAQVGSVPITKANFTSLLAVACARYKAQAQPCPKPGSDTYTQLRDQAVTFLVQQEELTQEAKKLGVSVTQTDIEKQVEQIQKTYYKNDKAKFLAALKKDDITLAQLEQYNLRPNLLSSKLQAKVTSNVQVSDSAAQKYYTANQTSFTTPKTREVRHILVKNKALAEKLEKELKNGASFATLAKKY
jgi:parvulin-like peptidyl-prolyl isomerase